MKFQKLHQRLTQRRTKNACLIFEIDSLKYTRLNLDIRIDLSIDITKNYN